MHLESTVPTTPLPAALADVSLIDGSTAAAAGAMSLSWWLERVKAGDAPAPAVRSPRCTRWRLVDVRAFWERFAEEGSADTKTAAAVIATATKASKAARAARRPSTGPGV